MSAITLSIDASIAKIALNRPAHLNCFGTAMIAELMAAIEHVVAAGAKVIILSGEGRAFCAGADLNDAMDHRDEEGHVNIAKPLRSHFNALMAMLRDIPIPLICAVNGPAVGGGCSLAICADVVIAAQSAYFQMPFAKIGLIPDMGVTWLAPRLLGRARALGVVMLGERISASQAVDWGLIWSSCEDQFLMVEAMAAAAKLKAYSPETLHMTRRLIDKSYLTSWNEQLENEACAQGEMGKKIAFTTAVKAFLGSAS
ncbi:MAG: enoyl-CoA hydratase-related protein [Zhongshania sp.]|uniref:enoyl-CoA hydratase-related protein n=1 Tax=Zhongshania sp. TaxID=1971902 RepID=UPI00262F003A|nr:enoyl-CoA hydratase-related protein [Zhongshania sp.]MDF1693162.1 enoyl-CoA hydratase-related protein [Zhongshania sp.]